MLPWHRIIAHYLLIALVVSLLVIVGSAMVQVAEVHLALQRAEQLVRLDYPQDALMEVHAVENAAAPFPALIRRLRLMAVRCHLYAGELPLAEAAARDMQAVSADNLRTPDLWAALRILPDPLVTWLDRVLTGGRPATPEAALALLDAERLQRQPEEPPTNASPPPRLPAPAPAPSPVSPRSAPKPILTAPTPPDAAAVAPPAPEPPPQETNTTTTDEATSAEPAPPEEGVATSPAKEADSGTTASWGIVAARETRAYDPSGKFLRTVEPGIVVEFSSVRNSSVGTVAVCTAMHPGNLGAPVIIRSADLDIRQGRFGQASPDEVALRAKRARLTAQIEQTRLAADPSNPHAAKYDAARKAYTLFWQKERDLEQKMNASTGEARMRYHDALRKMKGEDIRVAQALDKAKLDYDTWGARNPRDDRTNPALKGLLAELADVEAKLQKLSHAP